MTFDPGTTLAKLAEHEVRYVLIGGLAAVSQGSPVITNDLDICHDRRHDNLDRLVAALRDLHASLRGAPEGLPFQLEADTLHRGDSFTFDTDAGPFDILATPSGSAGYDDLRSRAVQIDLYGLGVLAASVDDLIAMKQASARDKDRTHLMHLEALREERQWREGRSRRN